MLTERPAVAANYYQQYQISIKQITTPMYEYVNAILAVKRGDINFSAI